MTAHVPKEPMVMYLMRHGDAVAGVDSDAERILTERGKTETALMAVWLQSQIKANEQFAELKILVSPYQRTRETLTILRQYLTLPVSEEVYPALTPDSDPRAVMTYLNHMALHGTRAVLVLSHLPMVARLLMRYCQLIPPPFFATAAVAKLYVDGRSESAELAWIKTPDERGIVR